MNQALTTSVAMTQERCQYYCYSKSYTYAALQVTMCFCGDFKPTTTGTCSLKCAGDSSQNCGDGEYVNIFKVREDGLVTSGYTWLLDTKSGSTSDGVPSSSAKGSLNGNPSAVSGLVGNAMRLSGTSSQYITLTTSGSIICLRTMSGCSGFTFSAYIKPTIILDADNYFFATSTPTNQGFDFAYVVTDANIPCRRRFRASLRSASKQYSAVFDMATENWVNMLMTWTSAAGLSVYIDGFLVSTDASGQSQSFSSAGGTDGTIVMGKHFSSSTGYASMDVDHVQLWLKGFEQRPQDVSEVSMWLSSSGKRAGTNSSSDVSASSCRQQCANSGQCLSASLCKTTTGVVCYSSTDANVATGTTTTDTNCALYTKFWPGGPVQTSCYKFTDISSPTQKTPTGAVTVASCKKKCYQDNTYYALLRNGDTCYCYNTAPQATPSSQASCDTNCTDGSTCGSSTDAGYVSSYVVTNKRVFADVVIASVSLNISDEVDLDVDINGTLFFSITTTDRACFEINFGDGQTEQTEQNTYSHTYTRAGAFSLIVTAKNSMGSKSKTVTVNVYKAIGELTLTIPEYGALQTAIDLGVTMAAGSNAKCEMNTGDGSSKTANQNGATLGLGFQHTYTTLDSKSITVTCSNPISSQTANTAIVIQEKLTGFGTSSQTVHALKDQDTNVAWTLSSGTHFDLSVSVDSIAVDSLSKTYTAKTPTGSITIPGSQLTQYKSYTIVLTVNNNVTQSPLTVNVIADVTHQLSYLKLSSKQSTFERNKMAEFTVNVTGGYVTINCDFNDGSPVQSKTLTGDLNNAAVQIFHSFTKNGQFQVTCSANDDLSSPKIQDAIAVNVLDGITDFAVTKSQSDGETNPLTYNIILSATSFGTDSCFLVDFGDGEKNKLFSGPAACKNEPGYSSYTFRESITPITTFSHEYSVYGVYTVRVLAFNSLSNVTATLTLITDNKYDCVKPTLTHSEFSQNKDSPTSHPKSKPIDIKVIVGPSCKPIMTLSMGWTVKKIAPSESPIQPPTTTTAEIYFPANALDFGVYEVNFTTAPSKIPALGNWLAVYIKVVPTPLSIVIKGGSPRSSPTNKELILDGSSSADPDSNDINGIVFEWYCAKDSETIPRDGDGDLVTTMPNQNSGGCAGKGPGRLNEAGNKLTISADSFAAGTKLDLILLGKKDSRSTEYSQKVEYIAAGSAEVTISCKINCGEKVLVHQNLALEGSCDSCTALDRTSQSYVWSLILNGATVTNFAAMTETGTGNKDVVIKKDQLQKNSQYRLKLAIGAAFSIHEFSTASYPSGGTCSSDQSSGTSQETDFKFQCIGFTMGNENVFSYKFSFARRGSPDVPTQFDVVTDSAPKSRTTKLPAGLDAQSNLVDVFVDVCSKLGACTRATVGVEVTKTAVSLENAIETVGTAISDLQNSKDTVGLTTMISSISQNIPNTVLGSPISSDTNTNTGETEKQLEDSQKMKAMLVNTLENVDITPSSISVVATATASVAADAGSLDQASTVKMIDILENIGKNQYLTPETATVVVAAVMAIENDLVGKCDSQCADDSDFSPKECEEMRQQNCQSGMATANEKSEALKNTLETTLAVIGSGRVPGQVFEKKIGGLMAKAQTVDPSANTGPIATDSSGGSFQVNFTSFVDAEAVKSLTLVSLSSQKVLATSDTSDVTTGTQSLSLSTSAGPLKVEGLKDPVVVTIPAPPTNDLLVNVNCSSPISRTVTVRINITDSTKTMFLFVSVDSSTHIDVYVNTDTAPNVTEGVYIQHEQKDFTEDLSEKIILSTPSISASHYMILFNLTCSGEVNFNYSFLAMGCLYRNTTTKQWQDDGLSLDRNKTTKSKIVCLSDHLTEFGANFFVPPNSIDFSTVFDNVGEKLKENAAVVATVCGILGIYFILALLLRRLDKRDVVKWATTPLSDNTPVDMYHYHVTVFTSSRKGAGTKSNVFFMLAGECGDTEVRKLEDTKKKKSLLTGSVNNYLLSNPRSLGPLLYLRIWHDNSGEGDYGSWHLDRIVIKDIQTDEKYVFLCDHWMAVDLADGQLERLLPAASRKDLESFQHLFYTKTRQDMSDEHLWFSLASRPVRSRFTRVQRLSCCLALLYATMIANCMFFRAEDNVENVQMVKLGPFVFSAQQLLISIYASLVSVPITILIVYLFRKAGKKPKKVKVDQLAQRAKSPISDDQLVIDTKENAAWQEYDNMAKEIIKEQMALDTKKRVKKLQKQWPWWFVIVAYVTVAITVLVSGFFTILYSFEWGGVKSSQWLTSFLLSFVQSVVIIQPIKVIAIAVVLSLIFKKQKDESEDDNSLEDDEIFIEEMKDRSCHPEKYVIPEHRVPFVNKDIDPVKLERMRKRREKEVKMFEMLREVASYLLYVLVICIVSYDNRDTNAFAVKHEVQSQLLGKHFMHVQSREQFWNWTTTTMIPAIYKTTFYNGQKCTWRTRLFMNDMAMMRVGAPRIRQQRVKSDSCKIAPTMKGYVNHCYGDYGLSTAEDQHFSYRWRSMTSNDTDPNSVWIYRSSSELNGAPIWGRQAMYGGGGYVAELSSRPYTAQKIISNISQAEWIDSKTRAVFIEVNLFNPNVNLFCIVTILFEMLPTGSGIHTILIKPLRLYHHVGATAVFRYIVEFLFAVFTLYFIIIEGQKMWKQRRKYFYSFWNIIELIIIILSIATCGLYGMHYVISRLTLNKFHENREVFTNFQYIVYWDEVFGYTLAFTVFLVMTKTLRVLRFNRTVTVLLSALRVAAKPLVSFFLFFTLIFCAFAQFAYSVFGKKLLDYSSFVTTLETQFSMLMMVFKFHQLRTASPFLGPVFFIVFTLFIVFVTMNILLSIINESFYRIQMNQELISDDYEVIDFMMVQFKKLVGINEHFVSSEDEREENGSKSKGKKISLSTIKKAAVVHEMSTRNASWQNPITYEIYKY